MTNQILVGCPVWKREWALQAWLMGVEAACVQADYEPSYVFVTDPRDQPTNKILDTFSVHFRRRMEKVLIEETRTEGERTWDGQRYERMVYLRNLLLGAVRRLRPTLFLSLDSDIFLHPFSLQNYVQCLDRFDAVGGKVYLSKDDRDCPSFALMHNVDDVPLRYDFDGVIKVDAIMAVKLMTPKAYDVDYCHHYRGEDFGWSWAAKEAGCLLGWDGRVTNKHVMEPEMMNLIDERCGF